MLTGDMYLSGDPVLTAERTKARQLVKKFNNSDPADENYRQEILSQLLGSCENPLIEPNIRVDYGYNIFLGKNFYANFDCCFLDVVAIRIGDNCMFGPCVHIYTASHPTDPIRRCEYLEEFGVPVTIGNNVWVGGHVTILPGINIGDNTVIGSGSVVTKNMPANAVVGGNPAKVIRYINKKD